MSKTMILKPRVSEKSYGQSQDNVYVFSVDKSADKLSIARAVEAQFDVTVKTVNTVVSKGKAKRTIRKGGHPVAGRTSDFKKAYVTLKEGDSIALFASEGEKADEKPAKAAKAADTKGETKATDTGKSAGEKKPEVNKRRFGRSK